MNTTKPFLTFAIPTWNRQNEVTICVESIARQIKAQIRHVTILVQDDCSTDQTKAAIEDLQRQYPEIIEYRRTEARSDYSSAFHSLFQSTDSEWTWTFGDDDRLEPGALDRMLKVLTETDCEFIHCAETGRHSGTGRMYRGTLLNLCNSFGWLDMTGFITCNVVRSKWLKEAASSPLWRQYAKSAFAQSCALLEVLQDSQSAYMDLPLVATQNQTQTQECVDRWAADKIGERYTLVADCLEAMFDEGVLTKKLNRRFFRYQNYHLWDRHITYFIHDYIGQGILNHPDRWASQAKLAQFLEDETFAESLVKEIDMVRSLITVHSFLSANVANIKDEIEAVSARRGDSCYPWGYVIPQELG